MVKSLTYQTHGERVAQLTREVRGAQEGLSRRALRELKDRLKAAEAAATREGLNFSRIQFDRVLSPLPTGFSLEVETWGPYLANFDTSTGTVHDSELSAEDLIGIGLAKMVLSVLDGARLVSLCDDYNGLVEGYDGPAPGFSEHVSQTFRRDVAEILMRHGALSRDAVVGRDYIMLSEKANVPFAHRLVEFLALRPGLIHHDGNEIILTNDEAENPLHRLIRLRSNTGRWSCEALDAAAFLKPGNQSIVHLVVLPDYMSSQQDRVWEILRLIGIRPLNYHNIFYDPGLPAEHIVSGIHNELLRAAKRW